jgi:hypothetical protein
LYVSDPGGLLDRTKEVVENLYKEQESLDKDLFVMFELFRNRVHGHTARYLSSKILSYSGEERPYLSPSRLFTSTTSLNSPAREFLVRLLRPAAGRGGKAGDRLHLANRLLVNEINVDILNAAASEGILAKFEDDDFKSLQKFFANTGEGPTITDRVWDFLGMVCVYRHFQERLFPLLQHSATFREWYHEVSHTVMAASVLKRYGGGADGHMPDVFQELAKESFMLPMNRGRHSFGAVNKPPMYEKASFFLKMLARRDSLRFVQDLILNHASAVGALVFEQSVEFPERNQLKDNGFIFTKLPPQGDDLQDDFTEWLERFADLSWIRLRLQYGAEAATKIQAVAPGKAARRELAVERAEENQVEDRASEKFPAPGEDPAMDEAKNASSPAPERFLSAGQAFPASARAADIKRESNQLLDKVILGLKPDTQLSTELCPGRHLGKSSVFAATECWRLLRNLMSASFRANIDTV